MKLVAALSSLYVVTALANPLSLLGSGSQVHLQDDESLKVPGSNPLYFCSSPEKNLVQIKSVDLDPNPPSA